MTGLCHYTWFVWYWGFVHARQYSTNCSGSWQEQEGFVKLRKGMAGYRPFHKGNHGESWRDKKVLGSAGSCWDGVPQSHLVNASPLGLDLDLPSLIPKGNLGVSTS